MEKNSWEIIDLNRTAISQEQLQNSVIQTVRQLSESRNKDEKNKSFNNQMPWEHT